MLNIVTFYTEFPFLQAILLYFILSTFTKLNECRIDLYITLNPIKMSIIILTRKYTCKVYVGLLKNAILGSPPNYDFKANNSKIIFSATLKRSVVFIVTVF